MVATLHSWASLCQVEKAAAEGTKHNLERAMDLGEQAARKDSSLAQVLVQEILAVLAEQVGVPDLGMVQVLPFRMQAVAEAELGAWRTIMHLVMVSPQTHHLPHR